MTKNVNKILNCVQCVINCADAPGVHLIIRRLRSKFSKVPAQRHAAQVNIAGGAAARAKVPEFNAAPTF